MGYLTIKAKIKGNKEAPRCRGECVSDSIKHHWVPFLPNFYYLTDKRKKKKKKQHSNTLFFFFSFFTYIKYIGKSAVAFCYHDCYVGRGRKGKKGKCFLRRKKRGTSPPSQKKKLIRRKKHEELGNKNLDPQAQRKAKELVGSRRKAADRPRS